ncbi:zinc ribbon domain-containing protein [Trichlorobacter ammonificans]|uniref:Zinc ribbon domain-containing protein n=1 Tax=Trichlorobacter ammonificans TaxID=2916410 RepID=A0ABM9DBW5_9BACT|nr:zinc ribbon domain-containing protein [Trichlorobacter ammonificans]CAH2031889.1 conserved membrane protein of unknown function [Trichlorobacter ammonificans]
MNQGSGMKGRLTRIKGHLTSLDNQPLGAAALVIIIFLDLFILNAIFTGLSEHTRQLPSPDDSIPHVCREIVITRQWNGTNRIGNLSQIITSSSQSSYRQKERSVTTHPICAPFTAAISRFKQDTLLTRTLEEHSTYHREASELQQAIDGLKGAYDTSLLEKIAKQKGQVTTEGISSELRDKTARLNNLQLRLAALEQEINAAPGVAQFWGQVQGVGEQQRQALLEELRTLNFWYPVKKFGMQVLFLLPLLAVFYLWNSASIKKNRGLQTLVSSHLLVVAAVPVFCKVVEAVYQIIPKQLLATLIELLTSFKLIAVWHYLLIALAVAGALLLIYLFQKKLFSREKLRERRIIRNECQQCGKRLPADAAACPFCGFNQFAPCRSCGAPTYVYGVYCRQCGRPCAPP